MLFYYFLKNFIKVFQDLGAKNLEPIEVAVLLKHPFIQDLISSYPAYKIPVSITQRQRTWLSSGSGHSETFQTCTGREGAEAGLGQTGSGEAKLVMASGQTAQPAVPTASRGKQSTEIN